MIEVSERVASVVTYTASGSVVVFGWMLSDIGIVVGIMTALLGYVTGLYFKWKHLQLARQALAAKVSTKLVSEGEE